MHDDVYIFAEEVRVAMAWKRVSDWLKNFGGPIATAIVILGALLAGVRYVVRAEMVDIQSSINTLNSEVSGLSAGSVKTNDRVDDLLREALERVFPTPTAKAAELRESLRRTPSILQLARDENIRLDPHIIERYGKQVDSLSRDPRLSLAAWDTTKALVDYRTFLTAKLAPVLPNAKQVPASEVAKLGLVLEAPSSKINLVYSTEMVPAAEGAAIEHIGGIPGIKRSKTVPQYLMMTSSDGSLRMMLDGMILRNVIINNVNLKYDGGPLILENVFFVNCRFAIEDSQKSRNLTMALLNAAPSTTFAEE